jgi:signal peptidase I
VATEPQQGDASGSAPEGAGGPNPRGDAGGRSGWGELWETIQAVVIAIVLALLIRQFVVETFRVDGVSMEPTLQNNERLLVNKFIYRFTKPKAGEIIIFLPPIPGQTQDFVKRVIAVGGQTFQMQNGVVYVNGKVQPEPYLPASWRGNASFGPVTVPLGDVWVLGDHRMDSEDSRIFGPVPISAIRGEAMLVWWPLSDFRVLPTR